MTAVASVAAVSLDCADPAALAEFYRQALDYNLVWSDENSAYLAGEGGLRLGFQKIAGYQAPVWPGEESPKQFHLDLSVPNMDEAEAQLLKLGATKPDHQPGGDRWRVLIDPAGHPFCITNVV